MSTPVITLSLLEAQFAAKRWLPPVAEEDKITIKTFLEGTDNKYGRYGRPLMQEYVKRLRPYLNVLGLSVTSKKPCEEECVAAGFVFFYGCLCYIMHFPNWGKHIHDIFLYNLLYILVDYYIDDIRTHPELKQKAIKQMHILIQNPSHYKHLLLVDPVLKTIAVVYQEFLIRCPNIKDSIQQLFAAEIEGLLIQKNENATREQYYDIACKKGGNTMLVLLDIVGNTDLTLRKGTYHLGTIVQLLDDSLDVLNDKNHGIHTIVTHDLAKGNMDKIWLDIMTRVSNIDRRFTVFIILFTAFAIYLPDHHTACYSAEIQKITNPYNLFQIDGAKVLVNSLMSEILCDEILRKK